MSISISFESNELLVICTEGVLIRSEVDAAKRTVYQQMRLHGKQHVLILIDKDFGDLEPLATWEDIDEDAYIQQHISRLAIVGDLRWRDRALLFFLNALGRFQIDYFRPEEEPLARAWLIH
jgi:SpoIIAA-like